MTKLIYMENPLAIEWSANIVNKGLDEKGKYFVLNETIVYPQGGGQPSDYATIYIQNMEVSVKFAKIFAGEVRHYYEEDLNFAENSIAVIKIDGERRKLNCGYHSAGHLIGDVLLKKYGIHAVKGHQFPGEAYIETNLTLAIEKSEFEQIVNEVVKNSLPVKQEIIEKESYNYSFGKVPYFIPEDKLFRVSAIEGYIPVPCGGTHVSNTREIGYITIKKLTNKEGRTKISYHLD